MVIFNVNYPNFSHQAAMNTLWQQDLRTGGCWFDPQLGQYCKPGNIHDKKCFFAHRLFCDNLTKRSGERTIDHWDNIPLGQ